MNPFALAVQKLMQAQGEPLPKFGADGNWGDESDQAFDRLIGRAPSSGGLRPSARIEDFIKGYEKCRLTAYLPTPKDRPTIGWGSTGPDIKLGMTWTQAQADARFAKDLADFGDGVRAALGLAPTTQAQYDAMVSFAYNVGMPAFQNSTLLGMHRQGDHAGAQAQFARWNKQDGIVLGGLTTRRAAEAAIYDGAI